MCGGTSKSSNVSIFGMWNPCLEVYTTSWWMGLFKSLTPKRHIGWSNSWAISLIDGGRLSRARAKQYGLHLAKSAISYEKGGKKKYQGTSLLKSTGYRPQYRLVYFQAVATYFGFWIYHLFLYSILLLAALPRTYPPLFGRKLTRLHRLFCRRKYDKFPESNRNGQHLLVWFTSLDWGDLWDDAQMYDVMSWLRGSRFLDLQDWREAFPRKL